MSSQMNRFRIAITGTPATGKSSVVEIIAQSNSVTVRQLAAEHGCLGVAGAAGEAVEIDVDKLHHILADKWSEKSSSVGVEKPPGGLDEKAPQHIFIDGHLSHHLPVDAIVVLRCHPEVLSQRMRGRGWPQAKINDNAEWEMLGGPWVELDENIPPIIEIDTTVAAAGAVAKEILDWIEAGFVPGNPSKRADWLQ